ncbi:hypothetical protein EDD17DRAFT_1511339 [Pisolithus thermaeus]|nr:hypothetical protein EV401DRAFT_1889330 [Pisolithus croceorrhizus]KAI6159410.1 hypothetical protein EDD17DRAFT_1511339 [Pisolithus thermaeus]
MALPSVLVEVHSSQCYVLIVQIPKMELVVVIIVVTTRWDLQPLITQYWVMTLVLADAAFRPTILGGQPCKPFLHKVQDHNQCLPLSTTQRLLLFSVGALVMLVLAATIDVAHQLLPPNSFFGLTLIVLGGSIMVAIVQSWEVLVRDVA